MSSPVPDAGDGHLPLHHGPRPAGGHVNLFRRLVWEGSIPISVSIANEDLPPGADRSVEVYHMTAPRVSYLPLLLPAVRRYLVELVLDESAAAAVNERNMWFEYEGVPLRWHWPIGLLYDYHTGNPADSSAGRPFSRRQPSDSSISYYGSVLSPSNNRAPTPTSSPRRFPAASSSAGSNQVLPWPLRLHLHSPPQDKLLLPSDVDTCRASFMSAIKEADFVRWGSTRRVTNLRRQEQDGLWEGVAEHDFEKFWSVASKVVPHPPASPAPSNASSYSLSSQAPSAYSTISSSSQLNGSASAASTLKANQVGAAAAALAAGESLDGSAAGGTSGQQGEKALPNTVRSVPMRFHLPDGAPVVQEPVSPVLQDGRPQTLGTVLSTFFPLLFPSSSSASGIDSNSSTFGRRQPPPSNLVSGSGAGGLAYPIIQGAIVPLEAEVGWLGSAMVGADGWLGVVIGLVPDAR